MNMTKTEKWAQYILWLTICSFTYLACCPIILKNQTAVIIIDHVAFLMLAIIDAILINKYRAKIFVIAKTYIISNKCLFAAIIAYVAYDALSIAWSQAPSYSIWRYVLFAKTLFLMVSICLCLHNFSQKCFNRKVEDIIQKIGYIIVPVIATTIIEYELGVTPYYSRVSTHDDYNTYSGYLIFLLVFFTFSFIKENANYSLPRKVIFIILVIMSIDLIMLSGSRRAVKMLPALIAISVLTIIIYYYLKPVLAAKQKINKRQVIQGFALAGIIIAIALNMRYCPPIFEKYVEWHETRIEEQQNEEAMEGEQATEQGSRETPITVRYEGMSEGINGRKAIWIIAWHAIEDFNAEELLFGRGNGYSWLLYEDFENEEVRAFAEKAGVKESVGKWFNPHNLFLTEMLNGGIVKLATVICLAGVILIYLLRLIKKNFIYGAMLFTNYLYICASFMLSYPEGLLPEDLFWLNTGVLVLLRTSASGENTDKAEEGAD